MLIAAILIFYTGLIATLSILLIKGYKYRNAFEVLIQALDDKKVTEDEFQKIVDELKKAVWGNDEDE